MISFFTAAPLAANAVVELDEEAAGHARARRVSAGEPARLMDGKGTIATGSIESLSRAFVRIAVAGVSRHDQPPPLEVIVPVADKDRMLWAAEKCAELQVTAWRPAWYARSRSVSPRGEGQRFREKVVARMRAALEQSGGAWLPRVDEEREFSELAMLPFHGMNRLLLDSGGTSMPSQISLQGNVLAVGPEGGFEEKERLGAIAAGWTTAAIGTTTLRFETATVAAVSVIRSLQIGVPTHGK